MELLPSIAFFEPVFLKDQLGFHVSCSMFMFFCLFVFEILIWLVSYLFFQQSQLIQVRAQDTDSLIRDKLVNALQQPLKIESNFYFSHPYKDFNAHGMYIHILILLWPDLLEHILNNLLTIRLCRRNLLLIAVTIQTTLKK